MHNFNRSEWLFGAYFFEMLFITNQITSTKQMKTNCHKANIMRQQFATVRLGLGLRLLINAIRMDWYIAVD